MPSSRGCATLRVGLAQDSQAHIMGELGEASDASMTIPAGHERSSGTTMHCPARSPSSLHETVALSAGGQSSSWAHDGRQTLKSIGA